MNTPDAIASPSTPAGMGMALLFLLGCFAVLGLFFVSNLPKWLFGETPTGYMIVNETGLPMRSVTIDRQADEVDPTRDLLLPLEEWTLLEPKHAWAGGTVTWEAGGQKHTVSANADLWTGEMVCFHVFADGSVTKDSHFSPIRRVVVANQSGADLAGVRIATLGNTSAGQRFFDEIVLGSMPADSVRIAHLSSLNSRTLFFEFAGQERRDDSVLASFDRVGGRLVFGSEGTVRARPDPITR